MQPNGALAEAKALQKQILKPLTTPHVFQDLALDVFRYQANYNLSYRRYLQYRGVSQQEVQKLHQIPFLPIAFFKTHSIQTGQWRPQCIFHSSGTTQNKRSRHLIYNASFYEKIAQNIFEFHFGPLNKAYFIALLAQYDEAPLSSLLYMIRTFAHKSLSADAPIFFNQLDKGFVCQLERLRSIARPANKIFLWTTPQVLFKWAKDSQLPKADSISLIETGGAKKDSIPYTRAELHEYVQQQLSPAALYTEYGMTELLSQAYSIQPKGPLIAPPWMRILVRDPSDPLRYLNANQSGGLNIIDLANVHSCAFIETQDKGRIFSSAHTQSFEVTGRMEKAEDRGCHALWNE